MLPPIYPENSPGPNTLIHQNFFGRNHLAEGRFDSFRNLETSNFYGPGPFCPMMRKRWTTYFRQDGARQEGEEVELSEECALYLSGPWGFCTLPREVSYYAGQGSSALLRYTCCWNSLSEQTGYSHSDQMQLHWTEKETTHGRSVGVGVQWEWAIQMIDPLRQMKISQARNRASCRERGACTNQWKMLLGEKERHQAHGGKDL